MLLALDTASRMISLALHDGRQLRYEASWYTANNHTIELTPAIERALAQLQLDPAALSAVAVSQGPGSFTGLRIGLGVAKGLAMAHQCALIAVPTLDIVAASVPHFASQQSTNGQLLAVLQAGRGRICAQHYHWQAECWTPTGTAIITAWDQQLDALEQTTLIAGEIDETGYELIQATDKPVYLADGAHALRRAGFLAEIAWARCRANQLDDPNTVTPIYLHQPGVPHP